jgi:glycosyltransferase involved in cell wall biosynthesis
MINIISPINQLGYGIAGLNILANLSDSALWPIGQIQITTESDANIVRKAIQKSQMPDFNAPCIRIWHQHDMAQFVGRGVKVGFPFFELDQFSTVEKHHLNSIDKLFVSSHWAKEIAESELALNKENICVVPLGVNGDIFYYDSEYKPKNKNTIFFNCGKWEIRKGHDILIEAFNKAFETTDSVELWMMCENPFLNESQQDSWERIYKNSKLGDKVKFISRKNTQKEVYNIMKQVDCGIFPARAEGWNLELLEMLACGKHVICTNYSAHTEFCNNDNAKLINISSLEPAYDGIWFHGNVGNWANLDTNAVDQLIDHMRDIHERKIHDSLGLNEEGIKTASQLSWNNTARMVEKYV